MSDDRRTDGKFLFGFLSADLSAHSLFSFGYQRRKKTGKLLKDKGEELIDDVQEKISELEKKGRNLSRGGRHCCGKTREALAHIEALQEHGRQTTANLRKRIFKNLPKKV